jgi:ADP-heptose:LPS heptosyltransferase
MQILVAHLQRRGAIVTHCTSHLQEMRDWFPGVAWTTELHPKQFDRVILQYDNTERARALRALRSNVHCLFGDYQSSKHGPLRPGLDYCFERELTMAENIRRASEALFGGPALLDNGLTPPPSLQRHRYSQRVILHPTSADPRKNWLPSRFHTLARRLQQEGWDPVFVTAPHEAACWGSPCFPTLAHTAAFLYESAALIGNDSGPGHLASNLGLPTVILGPSAAHLALWRPGWAPCVPIAPSLTWKFVKRKWQYFISVDKVVQGFMKLTAN